MDERIAGRPSASRDAAGLTLIEIMLTCAVLSLLMLSVLGVMSGTRTARLRIQTEATIRAVGPSILNRISDDIHGVFIYDIENYEGFQGEDRIIAGMPADHLQMITTNDSRHYARIDGQDQERASDICEVGYVLVDNDAEPGFLRLFRREEFFPTDTPYRGGSYELIYDRVKSLDIVYFPGPETAETEEESGNVRASRAKAPADRPEVDTEDGLDEWLSSQERRLPLAMEIILLIVSPDDDPENVQEFRQIISFPPGATLDLSNETPIFAFGDNLDEAQAGASEGADEDGEAGGGGRGGRNNRRGGAGGRRARNQTGDDIFGGDGRR